MRTKGEPANEPDANQGRAKKRRHLGVRKLERPGRPNPYGVQWREKIFDERLKRLVSKPKTLFFPTAASRDEKYAEMLSLRRGGMLVESTSRDEIQQWRAFRAATEGVPWQVVVAGYREHLVATGRKPCLLKVDTAVERYLAKAKALRDAKDAAGDPDPRLSADTYRQKDHKLTLFAEQFGHLTLDAVPAAEIESWIDDFDEVQSDWTFDNYIKHVSAMYGHYVGTRDLRENPCKFVKRRSDGIGEVKVISPEQTAQLFHTALTFRDPGTGEATFMAGIGRLSLEAFIGLRFSSGCRIEKSDINFSDRGILLPRKKLKTGRRHYIDELPAQVWDWLEVTPAECWVLKPRDYMELKSRLFVVANVPHPHNCLRHGFATYDVAANKNPGRTATILCHRDQEELWDHYNGIGTVEQGKMYQRITPQTAQELARGFAPAVPLPTVLPATPPAVRLRLPA